MKEFFPLDIAYLFIHSMHGDEELRFSLRSVAKNLPFIRKVWLFGDCPEFLSRDKSLIEHVPPQYIAPLLNFDTVVRDDFTLLLLVSLIPEIAFNFLRFADDHIILQPLTPDHFSQPRALENLDQTSSRGTTKWKEQLWRTYDLLKQSGYTGYNFQVHVPQLLNKKLIFDTYMAFRPFTRTEALGGILSETAMFNYAIRHFDQTFIWIREEQSRAGFYSQPPSTAELESLLQPASSSSQPKKLFLNFNDNAYSDSLRQFLHKLFPDPCRFERRGGKDES